MNDDRKREIRIKADSVRSRCRVGRYGIIDLFKDCENLGYKLIRYPLGENADLGFSVKKDSDIVIFTNSCYRLSREIFTLAHEIGHAVLHFEDNTSFIDDHITIIGKNDEKEQEANYFAACLLMPEDHVRRFIDLEIRDFSERGLSAMDIARIMSEFSVSFDMVLNRLASLGLIDANTKVRLDNERLEKRVGNLLRSVGGNAKLNMSGSDIDIPYEYIDYVIYNYNHNAVPKETLERVLECYQLRIEDVGDRLREYAEEIDDEPGELLKEVDF